MVQLEVKKMLPPTWAEGVPSSASCRLIVWLGEEEAKEIIRPKVSKGMTYFRELEKDGMEKELNQSAVC